MGFPTKTVLHMFSIVGLCYMCMALSRSSWPM